MNDDLRARLLRIAEHTRRTSKGGMEAQARIMEEAAAALPAASEAVAWLPSAHDWLSATNCAASRAWQDGWEAARNRLATLRMLTAPQPAPALPVDALRALAEEFNRRAVGNGLHVDSYAQGKRDVYEVCADELTALIATTGAQEKSK